MSAHLTSTELDDWSRRRDSEAHLPTLVRKLVMATVRPDWIRMPAAEGVALPGLDGVVNVSGGAPPYVPAGDSVWELGTNAKVRAKAVDDYTKRTKQTKADERARTTFVFVTSRRWGAGAKWAADMKAKGDGWKDIVALAADELAIWLGMCPGVEAWLGEHLGISSLGDIGIGEWFDRWSQLTNPSTPAGVLLAGRRDDTIRLLDQLDGSPRVIKVAATSVEEAVAFVAAALQLGTGPDPATSTTDAADGAEDADGKAEKATPDPNVRSAEKLEALRERAIVIEDVDGWRRWSAHPNAHILVPLFVPDSVDAAVDAGHHVVLPLMARSGNDEGRLVPLDPHLATKPWQEAGVDFYKAHEYALAARRNLGSLRRRLSRYGRQDPTWAGGSSAASLASALLAGGWETSYEGDEEVLTELTGLASWRAISKEFAPLLSAEDPPLTVVDNRCTFIDVVDAWDAIGGLITSEDVSAFAAAVQVVLAEPDPDAGLVGDERLRRMFDENRPRRRYSETLRRGMATSLAVLGSLIEDSAVAGGMTGQTVATVAVRELLKDADGDRWLVLADLLTFLAEAAPEAFLEALESSLRDESPAVMALFVESDDGFRGSRSSHSSLLWALETLAFSPVYVSRVCVVLARLAHLDPGGRLSNRPAESLNAALHLVIPQGVIGSENRMAVVDAVVAAIPARATELLIQLIKNDGGGLIRSGPRYRDWPIPRTRSTRAEYGSAVEEICTRLLAVAPEEISRVVEVLGRVSSADQARLLGTLEQRWDEVPADQKDPALQALADVADKHRRFSDAHWAMPEADVANLDVFLAAHGFDLGARANTALFSWAADIDEHRAAKGDGENDDELPSLDERRQQVVADLLTNGGIDSVFELAKEAEVPGYVGKALAEHTTAADDVVLDRLGDEAPDNKAAADVAWALATVRTADLGWLGEAVKARPAQAAMLLLCASGSTEVLDLVDQAEPAQQSLFWSRVTPYRVTPDTVERLCAGLLAADRPFSAITAASGLRAGEVPADLIKQVLHAPIAGFTEDPGEPQFSLGYAVGKLLDRLEALGVPDEEIASLEIYYLPVLDDHRQPRSTHRELARGPVLFADIVSRVYKPDEDDDTEDLSVPEGSETDTEDGEGQDSVAEEEYQFSEACFRLLHGWHSPLPSSEQGKAPTAEALQAWVDLSRVELTNRKRTRVASVVIGEALASPVTDEDGTWPCLAVRAVLEQEQDDDLEDGLVISRLNQRGVTGRSVYAGGDQERTLATTYREWSASVRNRWSRAGAVLESVAKSYDADGRREDKQTERDTRG